MGGISYSAFLCANMVEFDREGYLKHCNQWTSELAEQIAAQENIQLTPEHWAIIEGLRFFYQHYELVPSMRVWLKLIRQQLGEAQVSTLYVSQLFSSQPLKVAARIAGLPKPKQCL